MGFRGGPAEVRGSIFAGLSKVGRPLRPPRRGSLQAESEAFRRALQAGLRQIYGGAFGGKQGAVSPALVSFKTRHTSFAIFFARRFGPLTGVLFARLFARLFAIIFARFFARFSARCFAIFWFGEVSGGRFCGKSTIGSHAGGGHRHHVQSCLVFLAHTASYHCLSDLDIFSLPMPSASRFTFPLKIIMFFGTVWGLTAALPQPAS